MRAPAGGKPYWILLDRRDDQGLVGPWRVQFGSHDRLDVDIERVIHRDEGTRASNLKIVRCADARQSTIDEVVRGLNGHG